MEDEGMLGGRDDVAVDVKLCCGVARRDGDAERCRSLWS